MDPTVWAWVWVARQAPGLLLDDEPWKVNVARSQIERLLRASHNSAPLLGRLHPCKWLVPPIEASVLVLQGYPWLIQQARPH